MHKETHMTCLQREEMVAKDHPRICLRGRLDSIHAQCVLCAAVALREGNGEMAAEVEALGRRMQLLACEVKEQSVDQAFLADLAQWHSRSHGPMEAYGVPHFLPAPAKGETMAHINVIRTAIREAEREAVANKNFLREDLLLALNRLSSQAYGLMCALRAQCEGEA